MRGGRGKLQSRSISHVAVAQQCREQPGVWVTAGEYRSYPRSLVQAISSGAYPAYGPGFQAEAPMTEFGYALRVMFTEEP